MTRKGNVFDLMNPRKGKSAGKLNVVFSRVYNLYEFTEYLRGGLDIPLVVGIDFNATNRFKEDPGSLHHVNPNLPNTYQKALSSITNVLLKYNKTKNIPVYGFGAFPHMQGFNPSAPNHFFPCSGSWQNCAGRGIRGIYSLYNHALMNVGFAPFGCMAPTINQVARFTRMNSPYDLRNPAGGKNLYHCRSFYS